MNDIDVNVISRAIDRLCNYGWIKGLYTDETGSCCLVGAIDDWSNDNSDDDNYVPYADPAETYNVKIALAKKIKTKYDLLYGDFRNIVESGSTIKSEAYWEDEGWATATIMHFNDHPYVVFEHVINLLNEVILDD